MEPKDDRGIAFLKLNMKIEIMRCACGYLHSKKSDVYHQRRKVILSMGSDLKL